MKNVNILSIIEAYRKLSNTLFQKLMNSYGIISGIKDYELNGIESFVNELLKIKNSYGQRYSRFAYRKRI